MIKAASTATIQRRVYDLETETPLSDMWLLPSTARNTFLLIVLPSRPTLPLELFFYRHQKIALWRTGGIRVCDEYLKTVRAPRPTSQACPNLESFNVKQHNVLVYSFIASGVSAMTKRRSNEASRNKIMKEIKRIFDLPHYPHRPSSNTRILSQPAALASQQVSPLNRSRHA